MWIKAWDSVCKTGQGKVDVDRMQATERTQMRTGRGADADYS